MNFPFFFKYFFKKNILQQTRIFFFWGGEGLEFVLHSATQPPLSEFSGSTPWKLCEVANYWLSCALLIEVFLVEIALLFSILWLEVETQQCTRRVTVVGCQSGHVKVAVIDLTGGPSMILITLHREQHFYLILLQCLIHMGDKWLYSLFILWIAQCCLTTCISSGQN